MTDTKKHDNGVNPVVVGIAGAIIGAGIAVVVSVAMKDEKTKKKVKEVVHSLIDQVKEYRETVLTKTRVPQKKIQKTLKAGTKLIAKAAASVKKTEGKHESS